MSTPAKRCGNRLTFYGALRQVLPEISIDWNPETQNQYFSSYHATILPAMPDHDYKPVDSYTPQDIKDIIDRIIRTGFKGPGGITEHYEDSTIEKFKYLIRVVFEAAAEQFLCANPFAVEGNNENGCTRQSIGILLPKSFSIAQERQAANLLLSDPLQAGEKMGLALMFLIGSRNNECCGLNFGDIRKISDSSEVWGAWIYKTTSINSPQLKASGKSRNACRVIPLSSPIVEFLLRRRNAIQAQLPQDVDVDRLPIVCKGNDYSSRCTSSDISRAAKGFFDALGFSSSQIYRTFQTMQALQEEYEAENPRIGEKDPTAYFLRRNFATQMALLGLSRPEIMYVIGHDIEDPTETRNEFLSDDKLENIKKKMDMRISVNGDVCQQQLKTVLPGSAVSITSDIPLTLIVPAGAKEIKLSLITDEPSDSISLSISTDSPNAPIRYQSTTYHLEANQYHETCCNIRDYLRVYHNAKEKQK